MFKFRFLLRCTHFPTHRTVYKEKVERNFVDSVRCIVQGGKGGNGCVNFRREKYIERGGPDGGDGGRGGNVIIRINANKKSLSHVGFHQIAKGGEGGLGKKRKGKDGEDINIQVPLGTFIRDLDTLQVIGDISSADQEIIVARGGIGGKGNVHFATSTNRAPRYATQGKLGEKRYVEFVLKSIADVGLVGYPNAGKSTFMGAVSNAKPKVAAYPFTTLHPTVAEITLEDFSVFTLADIPGLIEGAHVNIGLGHNFLQHIERTKILMYVIDISGLEGMGIQQMEDGTIKYEFSDNTDNYDPSVLVNSEYNSYQSNYNINAEVAAKVRKQEKENLMDSIVADYDVDEDESIQTVSGNKLSDRRLKKLERKKRIYLQKRITTVEDQFSEDSIKVQIDDRLFDERKQMDEKNLQEQEQKKELYRKNRKQLLQPWEILQKLEKELEYYIPGLSDRAKLILANKIDLPGAAKNLEILRTKTKLPIFPVSSLNKTNLMPVLHYLKKLLLESKRN